MAVKLGNGKWAVKEDKLLAYNDNSGRFFNKEFDFSRGTSATYVAKDGLIKTAGLQATNLVTNGDFATDSNWILGTGWSISGGVANYTDTANNQIAQSINLNSGTYKLKFSISNATGSGARIWIGNIGGNVSYTDNTYQNYTNGDYTINIVVPSNQTSFAFYGNVGGSSFSIDNVSVKEIQTDTPRIDFTNDTKGHLLLEPQSTNLITQSNLFTSWNKEATVTLTANYGISPDGTQNSTRMQMDSNDSIYISKTSGLTASVYVKGTEGETIRLSNGSALTHTLSGKWDRIQVYDSGSISSLISINTYSGATARDIEIFGSQAEALSFPTSYIPTLSGSTVTRLQDVCNNSGTAQDFNSTEGVLYAEIAALADDGTYRFISCSSGAYANSIRIGYFTTSNVVEFRVVSGGVSQGSLLYTLPNSTSIIKIAGKYKQNDFSLWVNGIKVATDTSGNTPVGLNELAFDDGNSSNNSPFYGKVREVQVFTTALTDQELQQLTT